MDDSTLLRELEAHGVEFAGRIESTALRDLFFGWLLPLGIMAAIWFFVMRRMGGGTQALSFGRSRAKIYEVAQLLKERETFEGEELRRLLAGAPSEQAANPVT